MAKRCRMCLHCDKWILWDAYILYQDFILKMHLFHFWDARILCQNFILEMHSALSALSAHSVRWHPTSSHKQVWCYMRSDLLVYLQTPNSLQIRPLRLFKQVIWADIWQLPQQRNTGTKQMKSQILSSILGERDWPLPRGAYVFYIELWIGF